MGNPGCAMRGDQSPEEQSPRAWGAERGFLGLRGLHRREGSQTLRVGLSGNKAMFSGRKAKSLVKKRVSRFRHAEGPWNGARSFQ
jgi:hypothetical protein